jgi:hypothetical protein
VRLSIVPGSTYIYLMKCLYALDATKLSILNREVQESDSLENILEIGIPW